MSRSAAFALALLVGLGACKPPMSPEEKSLRAEVHQALEAHAYDHAVELAQRLVAKAPRDNGAWDRLVRAQLGAADLAAAKSSLEKWRAAVPRKLSPKWEELRGDVALQENEPALALESWNRAIVRRTNNVRVLRKIARLHGAERRWIQENETLTRLLAIEDNATDRVERALVRRRLHLWPEAMEDSRRAQELQPEAPEVRAATELFERLDKFVSAIRDLDTRLAITPGDDQLLADRALLFLRSGDAEMALVDSLAAEKLAPWAVRPRLFRALALLGLDRGEECEPLRVIPQLRLDALTPEFLETISRLDAEMSLERTNAELYVTRAWRLNEIGQPALAALDAENALRFDPKSAGAEAEIAYALSKLGQAENAFEHIKRATELDENFSTAWHYRGELEMRREDFAAAAESFTRALAINQTPATLEKLEECHMRLGQHEKAEVDRRALESLK